MTQYTFDLRREQIMGRDWVILDTQRIECLNCFLCICMCIYYGYVFNAS